MGIPSAIPHSGWRICATFQLVCALQKINIKKQQEEEQLRREKEKGKEN